MVREYTAKKIHRENMGEISWDESQTDTRKWYYL